jgi:cytochrome b
VLADAAGSDPDGEVLLKVWSPGVRILHWALTLGVIMAFATEDEAMRLHFWTGHGILAVILLRALMGLYGSEHVRFESFVPTPRAFFRYFGDLMRGTARRTLGHDPAGGAMIATILTALLLTVATGLASYYMPTLEEALEEVHETLAHVVLFLAIVHVVGVSVSSYLQRENLIGSMITGWKKPGDEPRSAEGSHE